MAEHTKGPWQVADRPERYRIEDAPGNPAIADVYHKGTDGEANARLIAASPALLAACEVMLTDVARYLEGGGRLTATEAAHVEGMRAAVAKAKGG